MNKGKPKAVYGVYDTKENNRLIRTGEKEELAAFLGCKVLTIYNAASKGVRIKRRYLIERT